MKNKILYLYVLIGCISIVSIAYATVINLTLTQGSGFRKSDFDQIKTLIDGYDDGILGAFPVDNIVGDTVDDDVMDQPKINIINDTIVNTPLSIKGVAP